ncbi:condensation domain-containing protein, partial [Pseudomonas syringae]|uniref:condensation domain-containing protein n=1 Tax=Pseudomonas syringae TaxID=317 RepID=UPI00143096FF
QVKIRGMRIELGEIESVLASQAEVQDAVVLVRGERLLAWFTENAPVEPEALREALRARLPAHMVPLAFTRLDALPLTSHGKLDRRALPDPELEALTSQAYAAPVGETEVLMADLWAHVLGLEHVGRHDHFFELGGHSLLAAQLVSRVRQVMGGELMLRELFSHPTVEELARIIGTLEQASAQDIAPVDRSIPLVLSFSQQRQWFLDQLDSNASAAYHMPASLQLQGDLDTAALRSALDYLVARHESLRTTFRKHGEQPVQIIAAPDCGFALTEHDLRALPYDEARASAARIAQSEATAPFDLQNGPLIRGRLLRLADDDYRLHITQHHIISDGWSVGVLVKEFAELYAAFTQGLEPSLPPLSIQYADYAAWQRETLSGARLTQQLEAWHSHLEGAPTLLTLPNDRPRPPLQSYRGSDVPVGFSPQLLAQVEYFCRQQDVTLFMVLLSAWSVLMARLGNERDIVIGVPTANRKDARLESLIGFFVNTLPVRVQLQDELTVSQLLAQVKDTLLTVHERQEVPFEHVIEALQPPRSLSHNPLCQVALSLNNTPDDGPLELPGLTLTALNQSQVTSQFDLMLTLAENAGVMEGVIQYATDLFEAQTIERIADALRRVLHALVSDTDRRLADLPHAVSSLVAEQTQDFACTDFLSLWQQGLRAGRGKTALCVGQQVLSFDELETRSNQFARYLHAQDIKPGMTVALCLDRSVEWVISLLALLKLGAVYLPLDSAQPAERLQQLVRDSGTVLLVHAPEDDKAARLGVCPVLAFDAALWAAVDSQSLDVRVLPGQAAYIIYTSGSTGQPKGVVISHGALANYVQGVLERLALNDGASMAMVSTVAADLGHTLLFGALASGRTL